MTRRGNGQGSVFRVAGRRKPWAAVLTVGWTLEGKPIRRARYASSRKEAETMLRSLTDARDAGLPLPDDRLTVSKFLRAWWESPAVQDLRPRSIASYRYAIANVLPELGAIPLRRLRPPAVEAALAKLTPGSRIGARRVLSTALKDAERAGYVTSNAAALAKIRALRPVHKAPSEAEVAAMLGAVADHRLSALYVLLAGTGLRIGEALGLRWEDIDGPIATVKYQLQRIAGEWVLSRPKTQSSEAQVGLPETVQAALRAHKARQNAERLASGRKWRQADLVFATADGQPVATSTVEFVLKEACKRAGIRHLSPHDLRRFVATRLEERLGREFAQLVLRHSSPQTTERYVTTTREMLLRAAEAMG